jgi:hypothetical protein
MTWFSYKTPVRFSILFLFLPLLPTSLSDYGGLLCRLKRPCDVSISALQQSKKIDL